MSQTKTCTKCGLEKALDLFCKRKDGKFGVRVNCKDCEKQYRQENKEKIAQRKAQRYQENKEKIAQRKAQYRQENKEKIAQYYQENKEKVAQYKAQRYHNDLNFKLAIIVRSNLRRALRLAHQGKSTSSFEVLGCSLDRLRRHIEKQFKPGMSWDNWSFEGWHVDHIKPLASFDLTNPKQFKKANHYTNLQPMWAKDNLSKGCRLVDKATIK